VDYRKKKYEVGPTQWKEASGGMIARRVERQLSKERRDIMGVGGKTPSIPWGKKRWGINIRRAKHMPCPHKSQKEKSDGWSAN